MEGGSNRRRLFWTAAYQCDGLAFTHYTRYHWRRFVPRIVRVGVILSLILFLAGFGFQFGSLDDIKTPLREQYSNILYVPACPISRLCPMTYDGWKASIRDSIPHPMTSFSSQFGAIYPSRFSVSSGICPLVNIADSCGIRGSCASSLRT
jgi:hypothetical protein